MTLYMDLGTYATNADRELLKQVPRRVAAYYLALPLAREEGRVTVVTAYPENAAALKVLERLLDARIVPVAGSELALQEAIARIYPAGAPAAQAILAWTDDAAWREAVITTARAFGCALNCGVHILDGALPAAEVMAAAQRPEFSLLVTHAADEARRRWLVRRSPTSLLLVRGQHTPIDNMLVTLRGYASDREALDRVRPLIAREQAGATILPLARTASARPADLLPAEDSPVRQHLHAFVRQLSATDAAVAVRLRPGDPASQVVAELAQGGPYGLLVVAAEAEGDFVGHVLARLEREGVWPERPILIVKPPVNPAETTD